MTKSPITCHVLDASLGEPAEGVVVRLQEMAERQPGVEVFSPVATGITNSDGRCLDLLAPKDLDGGTVDLKQGQTYKIVFKTKDYFEKTNRKSFYPYVEITFTIEDPAKHYHIPLLISPYSYTTYRGS